VALPDPAGRGAVRRQRHRRDGRGVRELPAQGRYRDRGRRGKVRRALGEARQELRRQRGGAQGRMGQRRRSGGGAPGARGEPEREGRVRAGERVVHRCRPPRAEARAGHQGPPGHPGSRRDQRARRLRSAHGCLGDRRARFRLPQGAGAPARHLLPGGKRQGLEAQRDRGPAAVLLRPEARAGQPAQEPDRLDAGHLAGRRPRRVAADGPRGGPAGLLRAPRAPRPRRPRRHARR